MDKSQLLKEIEEKVKICTDCNLCKNRNKAVPGSGNFETKIMFIGEGPGKEEDLQGKPFVGAAGKFLNTLLESVGLKREDVFITNVVKCRPPNNRDPLPEEAKACFKYLDAQIKLIKPVLIVTLGSHSAARFLPGLKISEIHGKAKNVSGIFSENQVIFPLYHPAAALYNPALRQVLLADMQKLALLIAKMEMEL